MNLQRQFSKLFTNVYFLYFIVFLACVNVFGYMMHNNFNAIIFFALIGYLVYNFSKNMTIVLLIAIIMTNLFMVKSQREGLENADMGDAAMADAAGADATAGANAAGASDAATSALAKMAADAAAASANEEEDVPILPVPAPAPGPAMPTTTTTTGGTVGAESFHNKKSKDTRIDYGTTLEDAYDDLSKILGGDGVNKLTNDTQNLMRQQLQLAEAMSSMGPLLKDAKDMLKGIDLGDIKGLSGLLGGITGEKQ